MADREKVIKALRNCAVQNDVGCQGCPYFEDRKEYGYGWCTTVMAEDALALLKEQGVKHGEWISIWEEDDPDTSNHARCSVCNRISKRPAGEYCRWCGAKMDLEGR